MPSWGGADNAPCLRLLAPSVLAGGQEGQEAGKGGAPSGFYCLTWSALGLPRPRQKGSRSPKGFTVLGRGRSRTILLRLVRVVVTRTHAAAWQVSVVCAACMLCGVRGCPVLVLILNKPQVRQNIPYARERDGTNAVPPHLRRDVFRVQAVWPPRVAGFISVWPCASED